MIDEALFCYVVRTCFGGISLCSSQLLHHIKNWSTFFPVHDSGNSRWLAALQLDHIMYNMVNHVCNKYSHSVCQIRNPIVTANVNVLYLRDNRISLKHTKTKFGTGAGPGADVEGAS